MILLSLYLKLALGFLIAGFIFHFIGFASPFWNKYSSNHLGLWTYCSDTYRGTTCGSYSAQVAGVHAARAFEVLAVLGYIVLLILLVLYIRRTNVTMLHLSIVAAFVIVALIIIGILCWVYAKRQHEYGLHFAFAFCCIGAILTFVGGILLIRERMTITVVTRGTTSTTSGGVSATRTVTHTRVTVSR